jgi:hypothetical protein
VYIVHKVIHRVGNHWILSKSFLQYFENFAHKAENRLFLSILISSQLLIRGDLYVCFEYEDKIGYDVNGMIGI